MKLQLEMPYKIVSFKEKRYGTHYNIPSRDCLVVPIKALGGEVACDIRWEDEHGELHVMHDKMFVSDYLLPLNGILHGKLYELWIHYYAKSKTGGYHDKHPS